jgi:hypothetical protein
MIAMFQTFRDEKTVDQHILRVLSPMQAAQAWCGAERRDVTLVSRLARPDGICPGCDAAVSKEMNALVNAGEKIGL